MKMEVTTVVLGLVMLILAMAGHSSGAWCVCKQGLSDAVLQKTLDYACGAGADCNPIKANGQCYNPDTVRNHCSYAVNSYFQKKGASGATCDFAGTATISATDPSSMGCAYPASSGAVGTRTGGAVTTVPTVSPNTPTTTPVTGTGVNTNPKLDNSPTTTSPFTTNPNIGTPNGVLGGVDPGMDPSGDDMNGSKMDNTKIDGSLIVTALIYIICLWN